MNRLDDAIQQLHIADELSKRDTVLARIHPVGKLLITLLYLIALLSFPVYNLTGVFGMAVYPVLIYQLGELSVQDALRHLRGLFLLLFLVGIANPVLDREVLVCWGTLRISGGMISFATLFLKGSFALLSSYALLVSTGMENLCYAMQCMHLPGMLIVVVMLIYRYCILFLQQAKRRMLAYELRVPGQSGVSRKAWGSLAGSMLLGSIDRAQRVYESMQLRGFEGVFHVSGNRRWRKKDTFVFCVCMIALILCFRTVPVFALAGRLLIK